MLIGIRQKESTSLQPQSPVEPRRGWGWEHFCIGRCVGGCSVNWLGKLECKLDYGKARHWSKVSFGLKRRKLLRKRVSWTLAKASHGSRNWSAHRPQSWDYLLLFLYSLPKQPVTSFKPIKIRPFQLKTYLFYKAFPNALGRN